MSPGPTEKPATQPLTVQETRELEASAGGRGSFAEGRGQLSPGPAPFSRFNEEDRDGEGLSQG